MFKRRRPLTRRDKLREAFWPSMGVRRVLLYYQHRMGRLPGTPEFIAKGMAAGIAISFTPFIGFHLLLGAATCWLIRGSMLAMVLGSLIGGNFWTLPLIWIGTYKLGHFLMEGKQSHVPHVLDKIVATDNFSFETLLHRPQQLLLPMTVGAAPCMVVSAALAYFLTWELVRKYKAARLHKIRARHDRQHPEDPPQDVPENVSADAPHADDELGKSP